ncbi:MAG TPA: cell division protein CrgA, partial [Micromonosporaceae bacterium]
MPKSSVRKKKVYTPPAELRPQTTAAAKKPSPTWVPATAVGLLLFAIVWLVAYYLTGQFFDLG